MTSPESPSFREALRTWAKIGCLGFGGPAGQIALMHRILVEEKRWVSEARFLHALNYCMLLPGPEAQQLATYVGWLLHRTPGGVAAGTLFVLPGFCVVLLLSILYAAFQDLRGVEALFFGIKPAVLAVVMEALLRIGRRALRSRVLVAIAALAFVGIFFFEVPFPAIVLGAGALGWLGSRVRPEAFVRPAHGPARAAQEGAGVADAVLDGEAAHTRPSPRGALRGALVCLLLWFAPVGVALAAFGPDHVYVKIGVFFSKAAVVTFGGAYAVLAYLAQEAVETYGWLAPGEMLDGLGLAETTPGPLILVTQFVGFMGAYRQAAVFDPITAGVLGAALTAWVTFVPCFLWIFLGAPYLEALRGRRRLDAALSSITAAVVGVVLNLAVWFALHVVFREVAEWHAWELRLLVPEVESVDLASLAIAAGALVAMLRLGVGMLPTLAASAALGAVWRFVLWT